MKKRPRCDNCGEKIYLTSSPWIADDDIFGKIPSHCPNCGEKLTNTKKNKLR